MLKPRPRETTSNDRLTVSLLGPGYAAIHLVDVTVHDEQGGTYTDIQQTGIGRYRTAEEAWVEARQWSESDELPLQGEPGKLDAEARSLI